MGLDITAYSNLRHLRTGEATEAEHDEYDKYIATGADAGFEQSTRGLVNHDVRDEREKYPWVARNVYEVTEETEQYGFRAGSYSGYGFFRRLLAESVGRAAADYWNDPNGYRDAPFFELINFSDAEGTIGPDAARDLLEDFEAHEDDFIRHIEDQDIYGQAREVYADFAKACRIAAQGGVIDFH